MRVLLVPPKTNYPKPEPQSDFGLSPGLPYLAGALKAAGHEVYGANVYNIWCHESAPLTLERVLQDSIIQHKPGIIGIGGLVADYLFVRDAIQFCRIIAPDIPIVCGGGIITYDSDYMFQELEPDYALVGEAEISLVKLVECLESDGDFRTVPSLIFKSEGQVVHNEVEYPAELDTLPLPDYSPFEYEKFLSLYNYGGNSFTYTRKRPRIHPIIAGRSCLFKCTFCAKSAKYRTRSIENVMGEIEYFYKLYKFNILFIADELFSVKNGKAKEFCKQIVSLKRRLNADFDWSCHLRVSDVDPEMLHELKEAGCIFIGYGFESASNSVLESMRKNITSEQILKAIKLTEEAGIGSQANFIFGDIAETPESISETIKFYKQYCRDLCVYFFYIIPYPGSYLYKYCLENKILKSRGEFYKKLVSGEIFNMTKMSTDELIGLTKDVMLSQYKCKLTDAISITALSFPTCDRNAPFYLRRSFYGIESRCPHCAQIVEYEYPLRLSGIQNDDILIYHYCRLCHKKLMVKVGVELLGDINAPDQYKRFSDERPYVDFLGRGGCQAGVIVPRLVGESRGFNLIDYCGKVHAVAQALGPLDVAATDQAQIQEYVDRGQWYVGESLAEVTGMIPSQSAGFGDRIRSLYSKVFG